MNTLGWDIVCVSTIDKANVQLAKNMAKLVTSFSYVSGNFSISGEFDVWRIVPNGSNTLLRFECPVKTGSLVITRKDGRQTTTDISGIVPELELQLSFISNASDANVKDLKFNCVVKGKQPGDRTPGAVTIVNPDVSGKITSESDPVTWGLLNNYLPDVFISNRAKLTYVFAQVNLVPSGADSWMAPKKFIYTFKKQSGSDRGYLCVLSVVTDRDISALQPDIDGSLLSASDDVFVLISNEQFLKHYLMPALPGAFGHGATAGNFEYKSLGGTSGKIINDGHLSCGGKKWGLFTYYPEITSLSMFVDDSNIKSVASGDFDLSGLPGASVTFTVNSSVQCNYDKAANKITFSAGSHSVNYEKHIPWYDWMLAVIGGPIILGVVDLVIALVTNAVSSSVADGVSASGNLSALSCSVVAWNGAANMQVSSAGLSQAFYIRGTY